MDELHRFIFLLAGCAGPGFWLAWIGCQRSFGGMATFGLVVIGNVAIMANAWWIQGAQPTLSLSGIIHYGSYAAIFDVFLAAGWGAQAYARRHAQLEISKLRFFVAYGVGLAVGWLFHLSGGDADSQSPDMGVRMHDSATSWAHNFGVMPAMLTIFICYFPQLRKLWNTPSKRRYAVLPTSCLLIYGTGVGLDQLRLRLPEPHPWHLNVHWLDVTGMDWQDWWSRYVDLLRLIINLF